MGNMNHRGIMYGVLIILLNKHRLSWSGTYKSYRAMMYNLNARQGCNCITMQLLNLSKTKQENNFFFERQPFDDSQPLLLLKKTDTLNEAVARNSGRWLSLESNLLAPGL